MDLIERAEFKGNRHPWEISRCRCILNLIGRCPDSFQYADIGSGDMYFTKELSRKTNRPVYAIDCNYQQTVTNAAIIQSKDIKYVPPDSLDGLFLMDVLEHVEDDRQFIDEAAGLLKTGGFLIITVPAFDYLFSAHDIHMKHFRRYNSKKLARILKEYRLDPQEHFYFYTTLFFVRFFQVILERMNRTLNEKSIIGTWAFKKDNAVTIFFTGVLNFEFLMSRFLRKIGVAIPGLSLCFICKKKSA